MLQPRWVTRATTLLALVGLACTTRPSGSAAGPVEPSSPPGAQAAPTRVRYSSDQLAYEWTLPSGWVPQEWAPERIGHTGVGAEIVAARWPAEGGVIAVLIATDQVAVVPGAHLEERARVEREKESLRLRAEALKLRVESSEAAEVEGHAGWRITGTTARGPGRFSLRGFLAGRREFQLWCEFEDPRQEVRCAEAFAGLTVSEETASAGATELQLGFVLDDPKVPVRHTPPSKDCYGRGPRLGGMGTQQVWTWVCPGLPQVEVGVAQLDARLSTTALAEGIAGTFRSVGTQVTKSATTLAGKPAVRLQLDGGRLPRQDLILLAHDGYLCSLLITHKKPRDERLIAVVQAAFELR